MEFIEIMQPRISDCPKFTVNNAVNFVPVTNMLAESVFYSGSSYSVFTTADNLIILSAGYFIPENFVLWNMEDASGVKEPTIQLRLRLKENTGTFWDIRGFGSGGTLPIPFPNYEISLGGFVNTKDLGLNQTTYQLTGIMNYDSTTATPDRMQISMVNVPAALNGTIFYIVPFVKVMHSILLT